MSNCPQTTTQTQFDLRSAADCAATLRELLQAYANAVAGNRRVMVRFNERWTEYAKPNAPALLALYNTIYQQCPHASRAGLPDMTFSNQNRAVRVGPTRSPYVRNF